MTDAPRTTEREEETELKDAARRLNESLALQDHYRERALALAAERDRLREAAGTLLENIQWLEYATGLPGTVEAIRSLRAALKGDK